MPRCRLLVNGERINRDNHEDRVERILRLRDRGVEVRHYRNGYLHQKSLLADESLYVGSSNFTQVTLNVVELGVIITLSEAAASKELEAFDELWLSAAAHWTTPTHGLFVTDVS